MVSKKENCQLINGSAYAPVRAVAEDAGAKVNWHGKEKKVCSTKTNRTEMNILLSSPSSSNII
nr:stalk domain-containing protein [Paenibacillus apiarius]